MIASKSTKSKEYPRVGRESTLTEAHQEGTGNEETCSVALARKPAQGLGNSKSTRSLFSLPHPTTTTLRLLFQCQRAHYQDARAKEDMPDHVSRAGRDLGRWSLVPILMEPTETQVSDVASVSDILSLNKERLHISLHLLLTPFSCVM